MSDSAELLLLCGKVRDEALTAGDAARLDALLQASDQAKQLYVRYMSIVSLLESRGLGQPAVATDELQGEVMDHDVFAELLQYEEQADAQLVHQVGRLRSRGQSRWEVAGAMQWVIQSPAVLGSVAAILFLALVLVVVLNNGSEPTSIAVQPDEHTTPSIAPSVATITATHNAKWAESAFARGSSLKAGQTLTLTAGFAEITTGRGAIAILEAPATVELLDSDNALRLHTGKLVGICETDSSKGFLVRTPHIDVTDLGTRFGVDIMSPEVTQVHVIEGEVQSIIAQADANAVPIKLVAGQSAQATSDTDTIIPIKHDTERFSELMSGTIRLPGTGSGLTADETDSDWKIVAINAVPLSVPLLPQVAPSTSFHLKTVPSDPSVAQWLLFETTGRYTSDDEDASYTFETQFDLPEGLDPASTALTLRFAADGSLTEVQINGQTIPAPKNALPPENGVMRDMQIKDQLRRGQNVIRFVVQDNFVPAPHLNHAGLIVAWQLDTGSYRLKLRANKRIND